MITLLLSKDNDQLNKYVITQGVKTVMFPEGYMHPTHHQSLLKDIEEDSLVVTHSEIIVLSYIKQVREKQRKPEDLKVIWLMSKTGFPVTLTVDDEGDFTDAWPEGFFEEQENLLF